MEKSTVVFLKILPVLFIVFAAGVMVYTFLNKNIEYAVRVEPASDAGKKTLAQYDKGRVITTGIMVVSKPGVAERIFWPPNRSYLSNFIECIFILFIALQVLSIFGNLLKTEVFRENIAKHLKRIGYAFIILYFVNLGRKIIIGKQVLSFSNNEFKLDEQFGSASQTWLAVLFLLLALAAKEIVGLRKEQDLTI